MDSFWDGYKFGDFLFKDFNVTTPAGFAGVFVSLVVVSIGYEGIRTLRDFLYSRFLASTKASTTIAQRSKSSSPTLVRYSKNNEKSQDEVERERLTGYDIIAGAGDAPSAFNDSITNTQATSHDTRLEDKDILVDGDESSANRDPHVASSSASPYQDTTFPVNQTVSYRRRRELMDLTLSSVLHMIYVTVGYTLMLAVMTFNIYILAAVTGGVGLGFYFFGPVRNNREFTIFNCFQTEDPCQERLLPSHDQSKAESSSAGSGQEHCRAEISGDGDHGRSGNGVVIGVQVHCCDPLTEST